MYVHTCIVFALPSFPFPLAIGKCDRTIQSGSSYSQFLELGRVKCTKIAYVGQTSSATDYRFLLPGESFLSFRLESQTDDT